MATYRQVYDSRHLQADCPEPGSATETCAQQSSMGELYLFLLRVKLLHGCSAADTSLTYAALPSLVPYTNRPAGHQRSFTKRPTIDRRCRTIAPCDLDDHGAVIRASAVTPRTLNFAGQSVQRGSRLYINESDQLTVSTLEFDCLYTPYISYTIYIGIVFFNFLYTPRGRKKEPIFSCVHLF